jgi:hypothetical protein
VIVRFVSSLSHEQETLLARAVLTAMTSLLDFLPIAYSIRIETATSAVYEHSRPADAISTRHTAVDLDLSAAKAPTL